MGKCTQTARHVLWNVKTCRLSVKGQGARGDCSEVEEFYYLLGIFAVKNVLQRFHFLELENYWSWKLFFLMKWREIEGFK